MPPEESLYPIDWLRIAEKDFERVGGLLGLGDPAAAGDLTEFPDYGG